MKRKMTVKELRRLIQKGIMNEAVPQYPPPIDDETSYIDSMNADQLAAIGADYDVDGNSLPADGGAPEEVDVDVGVGDGDADDDGVPDAMEENASNLVYSMVERFESDPELAVMMIANALIGKDPGTGAIMRKGFEIEAVKSALSKWIQMDHKDTAPMMESKTNTRWEHLAGLLKG